MTETRNADDVLKLMDAVDGLFARGFDPDEIINMTRNVVNDKVMCAKVARRKSAATYLNALQTPIRVDPMPLVRGNLSLRPESA